MEVHKIDKQGQFVELWSFTPGCNWLDVVEIRFQTGNESGENLRSPPITDVCACVHVQCVADTFCFDPTTFNLRTCAKYGEFDVFNMLTPIASQIIANSACIVFLFANRDYCGSCEVILHWSVSCLVSTDIHLQLFVFLCTFLWQWLQHSPTGSHKGSHHYCVSLCH